MRRRPSAGDVLSQEEQAEYEARQRTEARPMRRAGGLPRPNSDGYWDGGFYGVEGHYDEDWGRA